LYEAASEEFVHGAGVLLGSGGVVRPDERRGMSGVRTGDPCAVASGFRELGEGRGESGGVREGVNLLRAGGDGAVRVGEETGRDVHEGEAAVSCEREKGGGLPHGVVEWKPDGPVAVSPATRSERPFLSAAHRRRLEDEVAPSVIDTPSVSAGPEAQL
jgi:hypothetical protein